MEFFEGENFTANITTLEFQKETAAIVSKKYLYQKLGFNIELPV